MNIFVEFSAYFAAPFLAELIDANFYVMNTDFNDFFGKNTKKGIYCGDKLERINNDDLIIIGYNALFKIRKRIERGDFKSVKFIVCDTKSCVEYAWWNDFVKKNNIELYIMPDKKDFAKNKFTPIYQFIKFSEHFSENIIKNKKLTISHSPRSGIKQRAKGTHEINEVINNLKKSFDFDFDLITGVSQVECIKRKSKSHIFIDQLILGNKKIPQEMFGGTIEYKGGLGKSGLEAIMLNCATVVGGIGNEFINSPPVIWTDFNKIEEDLKALIINEEHLKSIINKQKVWIDDYYKEENYKNLLGI